MFVVIVEFTVHAEYGGRFVERVRQQARDSLELESECRVFDVCIDPERDDLVLLYEVYTDREAFALHLASSHFKDFDRTVRDWIINKTVKSYQRLANR